ncbi:MAG TPA: hypothetical protein VHC69_21785 [Polyangiaceae bacterium]|nr:hypothetical protein [Polyangiaceae bacterium]
MTISDAGVFVSGFLGFSRSGDFHYFADRVSATGRGGFECALSRVVPVVPRSK